MTRAYTYRGYTIDVDCEFRLDETPDADTMDDARFGFVAVVQVRAVDTPSRVLAPIRLADDGGRLFTDSLAALRAGRCAGEILVDDLLIGTCAADRAARG
ncbi:hypothetical protein [Burkholderia multivorans]|jgi:hypothetical protein|uniref:Hydrogenase maturation factor n=1 Tax=Burkholderia multivorans TaxID=87883 RepID=A0A1B4N305_9BURK|nr:hypothetical protein [Burkholderia multivorans]AOJ96024.1 hydrogenase maturation factor [Burkholderia multivorans]EKS9915201.1 hydrogenase maturation factor [Burkholderia multivorans]KOE23041.1 hydrogenase maturation factor [Burkholderia multivorans R-20526]MBH9664705.1 hydrogenase maturation factor [Burkholderia multivorans]MBJ9618444.1 hydrogenase maturation factor [Burkholderia multivorans]